MRKLVVWLNRYWLKKHSVLKDFKNPWIWTLSLTESKHSSHFLSHKREKFIEYMPMTPKFKYLCDDEYEYCDDDMCSKIVYSIYTNDTICLQSSLRAFKMSWKLKLVAKCIKFNEWFTPGNQMSNWYIITLHLDTIGIACWCVLKTEHSASNPTYFGEVLHEIHSNQMWAAWSTSSRAEFEPTTISGSANSFRQAARSAGIAHPQVKLLHRDRAALIICGQIPA